MKKPGDTDDEEEDKPRPTAKSYKVGGRELERDGSWKM